MNVERIVNLNWISQFTYNAMYIYNTIYNVQTYTI